MLRGPGHPPKKRSNESSASQPLRHCPGRPRRKRSNADVANVTSSDEDTSDELETESHLKSSRILLHHPEGNYTPQQIPDKESKKVTVRAESLLTKKLLASANDVNSMVRHANATFGYLKALGVDYGSFYKVVEEYIKHHCNLQDAERDGKVLSLSALEENYGNAVGTFFHVSRDFAHTIEELEMVKEKKETLKRQIEDLNHEEERLKHDFIKYKESYEVSKAKVEELDAQSEAKLSEIEQRKNAALQGIESTTRRLRSRFLSWIF